MKNKALLFIIIGGLIGFSSCKKGELKVIDQDVPDFPAGETFVDLSGSSWRKIQEVYFSDKVIEGIGTVEGNMVLTFFDYIDQGTYFLSGHLTGDTTLVRHGLHYWPSGLGLEDVKVIDGKVFSIGYWDGIGIWEFKIDQINSLPYNSWDPISGSYGIQPTALAGYGVEKIIGVGSSPYVRSISGNIVVR